VLSLKRKATVNLLVITAASSSLALLSAAVSGAAGIASGSARAATIACAAPANGRFPTISRLRVTHAGCTTARAVEEAIQDGWHLHGTLPTYSFAPYVDGPVFRCRYQMHRGTDNPYKTASCVSGRKLVTMELGS
jgi:hypothetical protein